MWFSYLSSLRILSVRPGQNLLIRKCYSDPNNSFIHFISLIFETDLHLTYKKANKRQQQYSRYIC